MRLRLVPLLLVALLASGCLVGRGEVVGDEGQSAGPPRVAPPLPPAPETAPPTATSTPDHGDEPADGGGQSGQEPDGVAPERNDALAQEVQPVPGAIDPRPVPWSGASVDRDAMTLTLTWTSGVEPCTVLSHVEVDYRADEVVVTIFEGTGPDAEDAMCIAIAVEKQTTVSLEEDIGTRTLVDGATT